MHSNFEREELQAPLSEINMTPLVDIMLVLLVIFLITAPLLNSSIEINLPKETAKPIEQKNALTISIARNGEIFLEEKNFSKSQLRNHLQTIAAQHQKQEFHLRIDKETAYKEVSYLLATLQQLGFSNVGFITEP
jgi:biopolymer transport protein ExbD